MAEFGGVDGIRNQDGLSSAVAQPQATFGSEERLYEAMMAIANKSMSKEDLADLLRVLTIEFNSKVD